MACFFSSAVMELFIHIPFVKQEAKEKIWRIVKTDFADSVRFIRKEKPFVGKGLLVICGINLFLSAMIMVGLPYLITEVLSLEAVQANKLCGFATGALGAGGLAGGICAGIFAKKLTIQKSGNLIIAGAAGVFPIGISLMLFSSAMVNYIVMTVCCFLIMIVSGIFTVEMMSFVQAETPQHLIGKVIAVMLTISMCAQPLGNALYGVLFDVCKGYEFVVVLFAGVVSMILAVSARSIFSKL